ncbi:MAG: zinc ribbon domain-containing protein [Bdellovibrionales bacterium]
MERQEKNTTPFQQSQSVKPEVNPNASESSVVLQWVSLKLYASRFFLESHRRIEFALQILEKLKLVEQVWEKDEHNQDVLKEVIIHQPRKIEALAEFYQYHLYKGGKPEILRVDNMAWNIAKCLVEFSEGLEPDFRGSTQADFHGFSAFINEKIGVDFKADHISLLERKGLFARRQNNKDNVTLSFDRDEFESVSFYWTILREVAALNSTGVVNPKIDLGLPKVTKSEGPSCPSCSATIVAQAKFCSECGHKIEEAA